MKYAFLAAVCLLVAAPASAGEAPLPVKVRAACGAEIANYHIGGNRSIDGVTGCFTGRGELLGTELSGRFHPGIHGCKP